MTSPASVAFLQGGGEMGERMRAFAWETTAVGPADLWPQSLKTIVSTLLQCKLPMYVAWGPEFVQFYNDAYRPILGDKHPDALGASTYVTWTEIWPTIGPMWEQVKAGEPIGFDDFKLTIQRFGYPEDCFFNFSYSPVADEAGTSQGVLVTFVETTARVRNERRLSLLDGLAQSTRQLADPAQVMEAVARSLGKYLDANRCAYAHVLDDENTFDLAGDYNEGVESIVGRYRFSDFGAAVHQAMLRNEAYVNPDVDSDPMTAGSDLSAYRQAQIRSVVCVPLHKNGKFVAAMAVHQSAPRHWSRDEVELVRTVADRCWETLERVRADASLRDEAEMLEILNRTGAALSAELDLQSLLQHATDAATRLTGAQFGAFFYNGVDAQGDAYLLYTLSGAPKEAFEKFGHPRPTALFGPTFRGDPPIRVADILQDPRYGRWGPHHGMPPGHLPVRSYLAVPVVSRSGDVIGGLFFGHPEPGVFTPRSERLVMGVAGQAAIAVDNARLYASAQEAARQRDLLLESERAARREAEQAGVLKDEFLATLSHELRTPLTAILGWVHILRRKLADGQVDAIRGVDVIERSTRVQVQLIDDLLDMSRITSGKMGLERVPVPVASFAGAAVEVIQPTADASGVVLEASLDTTALVDGDAARLQQIVWNLLANAVKFTPRGGTVSLRVADDQDWVELEVRDTGVGIPAAVLPHVFERFRQADGSIKRRFGGLGLGLAIVRHLAQLHGGTVIAESAGEGQGAAFTVRLPRSSGTLPSARPPESAVDRELALAGIFVLLVDDDPDTRDLLRRVLEESGATVHPVGGAEEALASLGHRSPRVIVSDIGMPGMDGYELIRAIRQLPVEQGGRVPAIALTAFARAEDRSRAAEAGFDEHLSKPLDPQVLVDAVARVLREPARDAHRHLT